MAMLIFIPAVIILVAGIIGIIVYFVYTAKINKNLKSNESNAHVNIPAPSDSARVISTIVIILLLIWLCMERSDIKKLQSSLDDIETSISMISNGSGAIDELRMELIKRESVISKLEYEITGLNVDKGTAAIKYTLLLSEYTDDTKVSLVLPIGGRLEGVRKNGNLFEFASEVSFTATADMYGDNSYLEITKSGITKVEKLSENPNVYLPYSIREEALPFLSSMGSGIGIDSELVYVSDLLLTHPNEFYKNYDDCVVKASIEIEGDGKIIKELDITEYLDDNNEIFVPGTELLTIKNDGYKSVMYYLVQETKSGLKSRMMINSFDIESMSTAHSTFYGSDDNVETIWGSDGKIIFDGK